MGLNVVHGSGYADFYTTTPRLKIEPVLKCFARSGPTVGMENQTIPFPRLSLLKKPSFYIDTDTNLYV